MYIHTYTYIYIYIHTYIYTYMHTFMDFRPQAPRYAYAALRHRVCGAGVYACVFNPAPHTLVCGVKCGT